MPGLVVCENPEDLAVRAADLVVRSGQEAVQRRGRFALALAGGSTPERTYQLLAQPDRVTTIEWRSTHLFFGDERFVPPNDARSNLGMVKRTLLSNPAICPAQVSPMVQPGKNVRECAAAYSCELTRFVSSDGNPARPRLDLILLGLGEDGHTASLFPGAMALLVEHDWATWTPPGAQPPPVNRITLTYATLNAARQIVFLVAGKKKAAALRDVLERKPRRDVCPAAGVQPTDGTVTWLVDKDATSLLTQEH
jgi:6-phosphogluconolactonase